MTMSSVTSLARCAAAWLICGCLLAACHGAPEGAAGGLPGDADDTAPYAGIAEDEVVHFTGTEPFWGGEASGTSLLYTTPDNIDGNRISVTRFAGRNGLSFSGTFAGADFVLAVTPGACSDGMSDRTYPFVATLQVTGETRAGCGWTDAQPFTGAEAP